MTPESPELRPSPLRSRRDATIQVLCAEFAQDNLTLEEFERRLDIAHRATALTELDALVADLQTTAQPAAVTTPARAPQTATPSEIREMQTLVAVMGGVERKGVWVPARRNQIFALMGGVGLDFREAKLGPGVTEVTVVCFMGGAEIIVPPDLVVEADGVAIMGGFEHRSANPQAVPPGTPVLKVNGFVMMGGVEITVRRPGETAKEARARRREEKRDRGSA
jgi:hypothetical protein